MIKFEMADAGKCNQPLWKMESGKYETAGSRVSARSHFSPKPRDRYPLAVRGGVSTVPRFNNSARQLLTLPLSALEMDGEQTHRQPV
jgi:hypothetical protein